MSLTAKQEAFAQGLANGLSQADAYRAAYDAENMKDNSIYRKAHDLMENVKITARVAELKKTTASKLLWTREMSVKALVQAYKEGTGSTKVAAVKELNAMHGFNEPTKHDVQGRFEVIAPWLTKSVADRNKG